MEYSYWFKIIFTFIRNIGFFLSLLCLRKSIDSRLSKKPLLYFATLWYYFLYIIFLIVKTWLLTCLAIQLLLHSEWTVVDKIHLKCPCFDSGQSTLKVFCQDILINIFKRYILLIIYIYITVLYHVVQYIFWVFNCLIFNRKMFINVFET